MPRTLAIIPARGGSKRLKRKNIRPLGGLPLLMYSIAAAKGCSWIDETVVSTEDEEIAAISARCQAKVFQRNPDFAQDHSSLFEVVKEIFEARAQQGDCFENIILLQPTSPLRSQEFLQEGFELFQKRQDASSLVAVGEEKIFSGSIRDGFFQYHFSKNARSQDLESTFVVAGSFYLLRVKDTLEKGSLLGDRMVAYVTQDEHALIDIDNQSDFEIAQRTLAAHLERFSRFFDFGRKIFFPPRSIKKIRIAGLTTCRSDFGIMKGVFRTLQDDSRFAFDLLVTGSHFDPNRGNTISEVREAGFKKVHDVQVFSASDDPRSLSEMSADLFREFGKIFSENQFDIVLLMGDRVENLPIIVAGLLHRIPFAHVHGGEVTEGVIDEMVRHSLSKMSHIHLVAHNDFARRLAQLGEEPWRIHITGSPALDELADFIPMEKNTFLQKVGLNRKDFILVTLHPETIESSEWEKNLDEFFGALQAFDEMQQTGWLFTYPGPDVGSARVIDCLENFVKGREHAVLHRSLGRDLYCSAMAHARMMVGNSSSGIIESSTLGIAVINVGCRQSGRPEPQNVRSVVFDRKQLLARLSEAWVLPRRKVPNPYQKGDTGRKIAEILAHLPAEFMLLRKAFLDW